MPGYRAIGSLKNYRSIVKRDVTENKIENKITLPNRSKSFISKFLIEKSIVW